MNNSSQDLPTGLKIGSTLIVIAGLIPFTASVYLFGAYLYSVTHPNQAWLPAGFKPAPYTLNNVKALPDDASPGQTIKNFGSALASNLADITYMGSVNGMVSGATLVLLSIFGVRRRQKWSWYAVLAITLWVGGNDGYSTIKAGQFPVPLIPLILGIIGLVLARPSVFRSQ
ncbi:hypothetical protein HYR99_18600 [Candidatus Poribacteria bacterium]|nr:hypothetical protein [Candidatus Poribacteria bacterium]